MTHDWVIECINASKVYNKSEYAIDSISFKVRANTLFGLIGPDGAGKSTLQKIVATLVNPTQGSVFLLGHDVVSDYKVLRKKIGYMPSQFSLYPDLSVRENLQFFASIYGISVSNSYSVISDIYDRLKPFETRAAGKLSGGMKQKLALCCALIHQPEVLILDEPTTGVDPVSRKEFWQILRRLTDRGGITILVSTPYMDEAIMCDEIVLMDQGKRLNQGTPQSFIDSFHIPLWQAQAPNMGALLKALRNMPGIQSSFSFGNTNHFTFDSKHQTIETIYTSLTNQGFSPLHLEQIEPTIEDYYLLMTQHGE